MQVRALIVIVFGSLSFSSCLENSNNLKQRNDCGTEEYNDQGVLLYKVDCDSVSGVKRIFERKDSMLYVDVYEVYDFDIKLEYTNNVNTKLEYRGFYKDSLVFQVVRVPGYVKNKKYEKVNGNPIVPLPDTITEKSNQKAFYFITPSFVDSTTMSIYKSSTNSSFTPTVERYKIRKKKNIITFDALDSLDYKLELNQYFNSGRKHKHELLINKTAAN